MRKILQFDVFSLALPGAVLYAIDGLVVSVAAIVQHAERIFDPLGVVLPYVYLTFNFSIRLSKDPFRALFDALVSTGCYCITGAISGSVVAIVYNRTSHLWRGIEGLTEGAVPEKAQPPDYAPPPVA